MQPLIEAHLEEIRALCRAYGVARLEVFGSAATGQFDPDRSDVDFLIEYPAGYDFGPWLGRHFELRERLEAVLGRPVDLVTAGARRNPYIARSIEASKRLIYGCNDGSEIGGASGLPGNPVPWMSGDIDPCLPSEPPGNQFPGSSDGSRLKPTERGGWAGSMMHARTPGFLWTIDDASRYVADLMAETTYEEYQQDLKLRSVVERHVEIIGSALMRLGRVDPQTSERLSDVQRFVDLGSWIMHRYDEIDHGDVWELIQHSLPVLQTEVEALLPEAGPA